MLLDQEPGYPLKRRKRNRNSKELKIIEIPSPEWLQTLTVTSYGVKTCAACHDGAYLSLRSLS